MVDKTPACVFCEHCMLVDSEWVCYAVPDSPDTIENPTEEEGECKAYVCRKMPVRSGVE